MIFIKINNNDFHSIIFHNILLTFFLQLSLLTIIAVFGLCYVSLTILA